MNQLQPLVCIAGDYKLFHTGTYEAEPKYHLILNRHSVSTIFEYLSKRMDTKELVDATNELGCFMDTLANTNGLEPQYQEILQSWQMLLATDVVRERFVLFHEHAMCAIFDVLDSMDVWWQGDICTEMCGEDRMLAAFLYDRAAAYVARLALMNHRWLDQLRIDPISIVGTCVVRSGICGTEPLTEIPSQHAATLFQYGEFINVAPDTIGWDFFSATMAHMTCCYLWLASLSSPRMDVVNDIEARNYSANTTGYPWQVMRELRHLRGRLVYLISQTQESPEVQDNMMLRVRRSAHIAEEFDYAVGLVQAHAASVKHARIAIPSFSPVCLDGVVGPECDAGAVMNTIERGVMNAVIWTPAMNSMYMNLIKSIRIQLQDDITIIPYMEKLAKYAKHSVAQEW